MAANAQPTPELPRVSTKELLQLYFDEGLSLAKVGKRIGISPNTVYDRLVKAGCKMRPGKRAKIQFPIEELRQLYFDEGFTLAQISKRVRLGSNTVEYRLKQAGYKLRPRKVSRISTETLRQLYFDEELTLAEVGHRVGLGFSAVSSRLRRAGYTMRPGKPVKKEVPSMEALIDDYVNRQLPVAKLAERTGLKPSLIWSRLRDAGVMRPRGHNAREIWATRNADSAKGKQADAAVAAAQAEVERLTKELAQAKTERAKARAAKAEALPIAETVRKKLADPTNYPWMPPAEVAEAFGIGERTLYRNVMDYGRLRRNQTGQCSTVSVIEQLKSLPRKK